MSEHNAFNAVRGAAVIFAEWTGSEYVEHSAMIRATIGQPGGEDEPDVNLTYNNGSAASPATNVPNIEHKVGNEDHWRAVWEKNINWALQTQTNTRPTQGEFKWLGLWNAVEEDQDWVLCFVRAIPGAPTDPKPDLNVTYIDASGDAQQANNVEPYTELTSPDGHDVWLDYTDAPAA